MTGKVLLTGAGGFIGSHVAEELKYAARGIKLFVGDITNEADVVRNLRDVDTVIHTAALTYVPTGWDSPKAYFDVNTVGTINLLKNHGMFRRFIYFSTSHVFGNQPAMPLYLHTYPMPADPYAISKLAAEMAVQTYAERYGFPYLVIRPFNNFGPGQSAHFVVPTMCRQFIENGYISIKGDSKKEFIYVKDTARAVRQLYEKGTNGKVMICRGESYKVSHLAEIIAGEASKVSVEETDRKGWDLEELRGDPSSFQICLPDFVFTPLEEGLYKTLAWYRAQGHGETK